MVLSYTISCVLASKENPNFCVFFGFTAFYPLSTHRQRHELQSSVGQSHVTVRKMHTEFCTLSAVPWRENRWTKVRVRRGTPKWLVKIMENPIKMDDLGGTPLFSETYIFVCCLFLDPMFVDFLQGHPGPSASWEYIYIGVHGFMSSHVCSRCGSKDM